jgi:hypothetical protein
MLSQRELRVRNGGVVVVGKGSLWIGAAVRGSRSCLSVSAGSRDWKVQHIHTTSPEEADILLLGLIQRLSMGNENFQKDGLSLDSTSLKTFNIDAQFLPLFSSNYENESKHQQRDSQRFHGPDDGKPFFSSRMEESGLLKNAHN